MTYKIYVKVELKKIFIGLFFLNRFSIAFLTVCENAVKPKLKDAETEANKSRKELNQDSIDIDDLEEVLQEVNYKTYNCMALTKLIFQKSYSLKILESNLEGNLLNNIRVTIDDEKSVVRLHVSTCIRPFVKSLFENLFENHTTNLYQAYYTSLIHV